MATRARPRYYAGIVPVGPVTLTATQFTAALLGDSDYLPDGQTRICYVLAAALEERARERRTEGRPDVAGRLSWLEGQVREGRPGTKRVWGKLRTDLAVVRARLCDGDGWTYGKGA